MNNEPAPVKMKCEEFENLCRRHGFQTVRTQYDILAKRSGCWIYADYSVVNEEKVTKFQAFVRKDTKAIDLTYVWQLKNFLRTKAWE